MFVMTVTFSHLPKNSEGSKISIHYDPNTHHIAKQKTSSLAQSVQRHYPQCILLRLHGVAILCHKAVILIQRVAL